MQAVAIDEAQLDLVEAHSVTFEGVHTDLHGAQPAAVDETQSITVDVPTDPLDEAKFCTTKMQSGTLDEALILEQPSAVDQVQCQCGAPSSAPSDAPNETHILILEELRTLSTEESTSCDDGSLNIEEQPHAPDKIQQDTLDERRSLSILPTAAEAIATTSESSGGHEAGIPEAGIHEITSIDSVNVFAETTISAPLAMDIHDLTTQEPSVDNLEQSSSPVTLASDIPDPFLVDDPDDATSDEDVDDADEVSPANLIPSVTDSQQSIPASDEIALAPSAELSPPSPAFKAPKLSSVPPSPAASASPTSSNNQKPVPPPPESDEDEDDAPEVYLPALVAPTMFLPIPNVRPSLCYALNWWLPQSLMYPPCKIRRTR